MSEFYLRLAEIGDMKLLFEWANDPSVRANSFCSEPIDIEIHKRWFNNCLESKDISIYILCGTKGPVGQIRLNRENTQAEISYSISSSYRGKGLGEMIIGLAEQSLIVDWPSVKYIKARVKTDNIASRKIFERCGYVCDINSAGFLYTKELKGQDLRK